jgi:hypothetical protein
MADARRYLELDEDMNIRSETIQARTRKRLLDIRQSNGVGLTFIMLIPSYVVTPRIS